MWFFGSSESLVALRNNVLWVIGLTLLTVGLGLLIAVLVDRVRYETVAKSVIFVPLAISMVAAGVIWKFMYEYQRGGTEQTGTVNAVLGIFGLGPVPTETDTLALKPSPDRLMAWMGTASSGHHLRRPGHSGDAGAARVDGATECSSSSGSLPALLPTIAVVSTTIIITRWRPST